MYRRVAATSHALTTNASQKDDKIALRTLKEILEDESAKGSSSLAIAPKKNLSQLQACARKTQI
jgi:hypothetical protein